MLVGDSIIFSVVYMLQAAAFRTIETLASANIFTKGIREHASYPLDIFPRRIALIFTFIIPFGTINYLPMQYLVGKIDNGAGWLYAFLPFAGALFILPCILAWKAPVRKYESMGS